MKIELPFSTLKEFLEINNISSDGVVISLPKEEYNRLSFIIKKSTDMMMLNADVKNFGEYNEMTIAGIKIKPRY